MLLYTPIPIDLILQNDMGDDAFIFQEVEYNGIKMQVQSLQNNKFKIIRLLSTDPQDYMRVDIQPGEIITL